MDAEKNPGTQTGSREKGVQVAKKGKRDGRKAEGNLCMKNSGPKMWTLSKTLTPNGTRDGKFYSTETQSSRKNVTGRQNKSHRGEKKKTPPTK